MIKQVCSTQNAILAVLGLDESSYDKTDMFTRLKTLHKSMQASLKAIIELKEDEDEDEDEDNEDDEEDEDNEEDEEDEEDEDEEDEDDTKPSKKQRS